MKNNPILRHTTIFVAATMILAGCANPPRGGNDQAVSAGDDDPCSVGQTAATGALIGAVLGGISGGKHGVVKGLAIGAAAGAISCVAINVQSRQTKTAAQADNDFKKTRGQLSPEPSVVFYESRLDTKLIQRGQPFKVMSSLELANGSRQPVYSVREEYVISNPDGNQISPDRNSKLFSATSSGRFENSFDLKLPAGVSQGVYSLKTNLYVNNKLAATRDMRTQVVWDGSNAVLVAAR